MTGTSRVEILKELHGLYSDFTIIYGGLWLKDKKNFKPQLDFWFESLLKNNINAQEIIEMKTLIPKMDKFKSIPPTINQFISLCKRKTLLIENTNPPSEEFINKFKTIYKNMYLTYKSLWDKDGADQSGEQYQFWQKELYSINASIDAIEKTYSTIRNLSEYRTFPPNINQFIDLLRIINSNENIPFPENAYNIAMSNNESTMHPLIKIARQQYGYCELRTDNVNKSKERFELKYRQVLSDYFNGKIDISKIQAKTTDKSQQINKEYKKDLVSTIDSILLSI